MGFEYSAALCTLATAFGIAASSCLPPEEERLHCDDALPPERATFQDVVELVSDTKAGGKGCAAANCHGPDAEHGYRLDEPVLVYDALISRIDPIYGQVSGAAMPPEDDGTAWDEDDLRLLRSWYCNGASPHD